MLLILMRSERNSICGMRSEEESLNRSIVQLLSKGDGQNDESLNHNDERMTNFELPNGRRRPLGIRHSDFFSHYGLEIRHSMSLLND